MKSGLFKAGAAVVGRSLQISQRVEIYPSIDAPGEIHLGVERLKYTEALDGNNGTFWINNVTRGLHNSRKVAHPLGERIVSVSGTLMRTENALSGMNVYHLDAGESVTQDVSNALPEHHFGILSVYASADEGDAGLTLSYRVGKESTFTLPQKMHRVDQLGNADESTLVPNKGGWYRFYGTIMRQEGTPNISVRVGGSGNPILVDNVKLEICPVYARGKITAAGSSNVVWVDSTKNWSPDELFDKRLIVIAGTGKGETRLITTNTATSFTLGTGQGVLALDTTSEYYLTDRYVWDMKPTPYIDDWQTSMWLQNFNASNITAGEITLGGKSVPNPRPRLVVLDELDRELVSIGENLADDFKRGIRLRYGAGVLINEDGYILMAQDVDSGQRAKLSKTGLDVYSTSGNLVVRVGILDDTTDTSFGDLSGPGIYINGVDSDGGAFIRGQMELDGDSRVTGTLSAGSPLGPSTTIGKFDDSGYDRYGMFMRAESGVYWWQSFWDAQTDKVRLELWAPDSNPTTDDPLERLSWRAPNTTYGEDANAPMAYHFDFNAASLFGTITAGKVHVQGQLSAMTARLGVMDTAGIVLGTPADEANRSGFYAWYLDPTDSVYDASAYNTFAALTFGGIDVDGFVKGWEFVKDDVVQTWYDYEYGRLVFGPKNRTSQFYALSDAGPQYFVQRSSNYSVSANQGTLWYKHQRYSSTSAPSSDDLIGRSFMIRRDSDGNEFAWEYWMEVFHEDDAETTNLQRSINLRAYGPTSQSHHASLTLRTYPDLNYSQVALDGNELRFDGVLVNLPGLSRSISGGGGVWRFSSSEGLDLQAGIFSPPQSFGALNDGQLGVGQESNTDVLIAGGFNHSGIVHNHFIGIDNRTDPGNPRAIFKVNGVRYYLNLTPE